MTIDEKIRDDKLLNNINRETEKYQKLQKLPYHQVNLINMNILQVKVITFSSKSSNTTSFLILHYAKN